MFNGTEEEICLSALINVNIPKFTDSDLQLFLAITKDLFPSVSEIEVDEDLNLYNSCSELDF